MVDDTHDDFRIRAERVTGPPVVCLDYCRTHGRFRGSWQITPEVSGRLDYYVRAGSDANKGKFRLTIAPGRAKSGLGNLYWGTPIDAILLKIGPTEFAVRANDADVVELEVEVESESEPKSVASRSMVAKAAQSSDPAPMAAATAATPATPVYVSVNLRFGAGPAARIEGWIRLPKERDITNLRATFGPNVSIAGVAVIHPDRLLLADNVARMVYCVNAVGRRVPGDISNAMLNEAGSEFTRGISPKGLAYDSGQQKLYVLSLNGAVGVFRIKDVAEHNQTATYDGSISAATINNADDGHRWGIAVDGRDVYIGYYNGSVRCFTDRKHAPWKDIPAATFGNRGMFGMTVAEEGLLLVGHRNMVNGFDLATREVVPQAHIKTSRLEKLNNPFEIGGLGYDNVGGILYVEEHQKDRLHTFQATRTAYPEYSFRTLDRDALQHAVSPRKLYDSLAPGITEPPLEITAASAAVSGSFREISSVADLRNLDGILSAELSLRVTNVVPPRHGSDRRRVGKYQRPVGRLVNNRSAEARGRLPRRRRRNWRGEADRGQLL